MFCFPPGIVCSCVGNCSDAFPNVVHWEGKYKMSLHLAWLESRILGEYHIVTVSSGDNLPIWELLLFWELGNSAKPATYPTLQPETFCFCLYQQSSRKNCLGKLKERDTIYQLPILAPLLLSSADFESQPRSMDSAMDLLWWKTRVCNSPLVSHMYMSLHCIPIHPF